MSTTAMRCDLMNINQPICFLVFMNNNEPPNSKRFPALLQTHLLLSTKHTVTLVGVADALCVDNGCVTVLIMPVFLDE